MCVCVTTQVLYQHHRGRTTVLTVCQTLVGADTRGAFVQPALYEAFGLTVIEAMTCGLPCFATNRGGPAEIIKNGMSGYHIECAPRSNGALL